MLVVKPWIEPSPDPLTSQLVAGSPVFWFSHAIGLIVAPQLLCACMAIREPSVVANKQRAATAPSPRRIRINTLLDISTPLERREAQRTPAGASLRKSPGRRLNA